MIKTVLFGRACEVDERALKMFVRKETLVKQATEFKAQGNDAELSRVIQSIIRINRKIAASGFHVMYQ